MDTGLKGKVAVVTGGSRGIGRAIALHLAAEGAPVVVNYVERADAAGAVIAEIRQAGGNAVAVRADVAERQAVAALVERTGAGGWVGGGCPSVREPSSPSCESGVADAS